MTASLKSRPAVAELDRAPQAPTGDIGSDAAMSGLEWLLEISSQLIAAGSWMGSEARRERLHRLLTASVQHLGCALGALIVPTRHLRLVVVSCETSQIKAGVLADLEAPVLSRVCRQDELMLVNRARVGNSPRLRLIAVRVAPRRAEGALLLVRPAEAPQFTRVHLVLAMHVSRLIAAALESDLDPASGLYTRTGLQGELEAWRSSEEATGSAHAILAIKIDGLDAVNTSSGFGTGDALIAGVAGLLQALHGPPDALAGRIASNELALILRNAGLDRARVAAETLQRLGGNLLSGVAGAQEPISLSCGIAAFRSVTDFEVGLARAQLARKGATKPGLGRIERPQDADVSIIERHTEAVAVRDLAGALRENRLTLFAQQIVPLHPGLENGGYELLLRSTDDLAGNCTPRHLLLAAQRSHLAPAVDLWIIERALTEAAPHRTKLRDANVALSINISGPSLLDSNAKDRIRWLIAESHIGPTRITFEITETVSVLRLARAVAFIQELRALGCRFALDDFGTGVSSLKSLTTLPVDRVKIDGSLIAELRTSPKSESKVRAIVALARDLGVSTVAESVESLEVIERLRELGVEYAQGYAIDMPRPLAEVLRDISAQPCERFGPRVDP